MQFYEVMVTNIYRLINKSRQQPSVYSISYTVEQILSSGVLKTLIQNIVYQNIIKDKNLIKVIRGIYIEFNQIKEKDLPYNPPELAELLCNDVDRVTRFGQVHYYLHKCMLIVRFDVAFIGVDYQAPVASHLQRTRTDSIVVNNPVLTNYIQIITNKFEFYIQMFQPEQIVALLFNRFEVDN